MADQKVTELVEETSPATSDLLYLVDDPGVSPVSKKATVANVVKAGWPDVGARVYHNADQNIAASSYTPLAFNSERYDTHGFHDTVINNERLTVPAGQGGKYLVGFNIRWTSEGAGATSVIHIELNGAGTYIAGKKWIQHAAGVAFYELNTVYALAAGEYVTAVVYTNDGGGDTIAAQPNYSPEFWIQRIG